MTDDRELLELAAKAAGMDVSFIGPLGVYTRATDTQAWNPLTDDGDALRLAVKLGIDITFNAFGGGEVMASDGIGDRFDGWFTEGYADDTYAATRRAIVRAAAEIGRSME